MKRLLVTVGWILLGVTLAKSGLHMSGWQYWIILLCAGCIQITAALTAGN